jgi:3-oxoacyl-[acyl-carrier-protein] synthase III
MIGINYIDYYIPGEELPITDLLDGINEKSLPPCFKDKQEYAGFIENILKLKSIRIETKLDEASMIGRVIEKMFDSQFIKPGDIDIIMATQEPGYLTQPNIAKMLQFKYKMSNAYVIHVNGNHCANIEIAIDLAGTILQRQQDLNNILVVTSSKAEKIEKRIFGAYAVVGDAAGIMLVSRNRFDDGKYSIRLKDNVVISSAKLYDADVNDDNSIIHCIGYVKCISDLIKKNSINDSHIEKILVQNANPLVITQCMASAGLDKNKIFNKNVGKYGHMDYVDFTINLKDILDEGIANKDRYILTFGTGHTGSYVSCLFTFNN